MAKVKKIKKSIVIKENPVKEETKAILRQVASLLLSESLENFSHPHNFKIYTGSGPGGPVVVWNIRIKKCVEKLREVKEKNKSRAT